jgi:hypothetical protein
MTRADAWTDYELQLLYQTVNDLNWFAQVAPFIDRSEAAIRVKMTAIRREAGIVPMRSGPVARAAPMVVQDKARRGSDRLRDAMLAMVA